MAVQCLFRLCPVASVAKLWQSCGEKLNGTPKSPISRPLDSRATPYHGRMMKIDIKAVLQNIPPYRLNHETCYGLAKVIYPQIKELLDAGYSKKQVCYAIEKTMGIELNLNTFYAALRQIRLKKGTFGRLSNGSQVVSIKPSVGGSSTHKAGGYSSDMDKENTINKYKNKPKEESQ